MVLISLRPFLNVIKIPSVSGPSSKYSAKIRKKQLFCYAIFYGSVGSGGEFCGSPTERVRGVYLVDKRGSRIIHECAHSHHKLY